MKLWINFNKAAIHIAVEKNKYEMVKMLLNYPKTDVNILTIS